MYQERISRVLAAMERMGLEQMLVSDPDSIWYLTGYDVFPFERLYAFYLRKDGQHKLFLNKLFPVPEAPYEQVWFSDTDDYLAILANAVDGEKDMGVDKDWPARFLLPLMAHNPSCKYVLASDCVDDTRACKDAVERDLMREASRIGSSQQPRRQSCGAFRCRQHRGVRQRPPGKWSAVPPQPRRQPVQSPGFSAGQPVPAERPHNPGCRRQPLPGQVCPNR